MRLLEPRFLTTIIVIGLCSFAIAKGAAVVRFVDVKADVGSQRLSVDALKPYFDVSGVAGAAMAALPSEIKDVGDIERTRERAAQLAMILSVRPLSSVDWLSLAGMRLVTAEPPAKVLEAVAMSRLTGMNEGSVMIPRGIFGLLQWESLPVEERQQAIKDLGAAVLAGIVQDSDTETVRGVVAAKASDTRQEIADLLRARGVSTKAVAHLGL
jgi:hypothetical protein